jgi:hypothetical protein
MTITTLELSLFYKALPSTGSNIAVPKQDNVRINVTLRRFRVTIVTVENQYVLIILGLCLKLVFQHTKCMRGITLSSVACLALPIFSMLFHKRHDFLKQSY